MEKIQFSSKIKVMLISSNIRWLVHHELVLEEKDLNKVLFGRIA